MTDYLRAAFHVAGNWERRTRIGEKHELVPELFDNDFARSHTERAITEHVLTETFRRNLVMITTTGLQWTVKRPRRGGGVDEIPLDEAGELSPSDMVVCSLEGDCIPQLREEAR